MRLCLVCACACQCLHVSAAARPPRQQPAAHHCRRPAPYPIPAPHRHTVLPRRRIPVTRVPAAHRCTPMTCPCRHHPAGDHRGVGGRGPGRGAVVPGPGVHVPKGHVSGRAGAAGERASRRSGGACRRVEEEDARGQGSGAGLAGCDQQSDGSIPEAEQVARVRAGFEAVRGNPSWEREGPAEATEPARDAWLPIGGRARGCSKSRGVQGGRRPALGNGATGQWVPRVRL